MTEVNFGSTYRIPITQAGVNNSKKLRLRSLISSYPNSLIGKSKTSYARLSIPNEQDNAFIRKLREIGYRIYQVFEGENISKEKLDDYIKNSLKSNEYNQVGKQKTNKVNNSKIRNTFYDYSNSLEAETDLKSKKFSTNNNVDNKKRMSGNKIISNQSKEQLEESVFYNRDAHEVEKQNKIRATKSYKDTVDKYGKEAAEAIFFYSRKK